MWYVTKLRSGCTMLRICKRHSRDGPVLRFTYKTNSRSHSDLQKPRGCVCVEQFALLNTAFCSPSGGGQCVSIFTTHAQEVPICVCLTAREIAFLLRAHPNDAHIGPDSSYWPFIANLIMWYVLADGERCQRCRGFKQDAFCEHQIWSWGVRSSSFLLFGWLTLSPNCRWAACLQYFVAYTYEWKS